MTWFRVIWFLPVLLLICQPAAAEKYTWEDLQVLAEEESWTELLEHARDIRPSKRRGDWKTWVEAAALSVVEASQTEGDAAASFALIETLLKKFSALKKSSTFMAKRAETGLKKFRRCFAAKRVSVDDCLDGLTSFAVSYKAAPDVPLQAARLAMAHVREPYAVPLYLAAVDGRPGNAACTDRGLARATLRALTNQDPKKGVSAARRIAFEFCWRALKPAILEKFANSHLGSAYQANTCGPLLEYKALSGLRARICEHMSAKGQLFQPS